MKAVKRILCGATALAGLLCHSCSLNPHGEDPSVESAGDFAPTSGQAVPGPTPAVSPGVILSDDEAPEPQPAPQVPLGGTPVAVPVGPAGPMPVPPASPTVEVPRAVEDALQIEADSGAPVEAEAKADAGAPVEAEAEADSDAPVEAETEDAGVLQ